MGSHQPRLLKSNWLRAVDGRSFQKATQLVKMLKAWKRECNVEIRSICLETIAIFFVDQWQHKDVTNLFWHDWMVRDFFNFAYQYSTGGKARPAGIDEWISAGEWQSKCLSAYSRALKACQYEHDDQSELAIEEWQKIFGCQFGAKPRVSVAPALSTYGMLAGLRA